MNERVVIVGGGIFGVTAALELCRRGYRVRVLEASVPPAPAAASTDISKMIRLAYGADPTYVELAERALERWAELNLTWQRDGRPRLFHDVGLLLVCRESMRPGGFEHDSYRLLRDRGHSPERLDGAALSARYPAWSADFSDGFLEPGGGYVESAGAVWAWADAARLAGVEILTNTPATSVAAEGGRAIGVEDASGEIHPADQVVIAAGSWTRELVPELAMSLERHDHPVWHLRPAKPELFRAESFPVFTADISKTGYYGFPIHPVHAVVKVGHHGPPIEPVESPDGAGPVPPASATEAMRDFLATALPDLAGAEIVHSDVCPYSDTADEHFWIARSPGLDGLTVAAGGSGHAFKFAPLLGDWIADTVEGAVVRGAGRDLSALWRWRPTPDPSGAGRTGLAASEGIDPSRCRN